MKVMVKKKKLRKKTGQLGRIHLLLIGLALLLGGSFLYAHVFAGKPGGSGVGGYDLAGGCAQQTTRPCYDKLTSSGVNLLGKNGENSFISCTTNAAPNKVGVIMQKTSVCGEEKVEYCHDGTSSNFIRKFAGTCSTEPPPSPPPTVTPSPTSAPISSNPFRITYPNGGEQLPYGSHQVVKWTGGDTVNTWPIYLSIIDRTRNTAIREMVINTPNDGGEDWIVDLPLGTYYVYYGQGCRDGNCSSPSQWDQSDATFSVVAGAPIEKVVSNYLLNQSLVILSASGGETWQAGSAQTIKWSGGTNSWNISLSLIDNTAWTTYTTLFTNLSNSGSQAWTVPDYVPPGQYKLYVSCANCGSAPSGYTGGFYNYSFYPFTIK